MGLFEAMLKPMIQIMSNDLKNLDLSPPSAVNQGHWQQLTNETSNSDSMTLATVEAARITPHLLNMTSKELQHA